LHFFTLFFTLFTLSVMRLLSRLPSQPSSFVFLWVVFVVLALQAAPILAHDTWVMPQKRTIANNEHVRLAVTSGMAFPRTQHQITPDRIERSMVRIGTVNSTLINAALAPTLLSISGAIGGAGTGACAVVLRPRSLELKPREVAHYLAEIGASDSLQAAWKKPAKGQRWRERYAKHTKTFIAVCEKTIEKASENTVETNALKAAQQDSSWLQALGMKLEIIPQKNPHSLRVGDELTVLVLRDGKPLPGFALGCRAANQKASPKQPALKRTDAQGMVSFTLAKQGWHLLHGTDLRPAAAEHSATSTASPTSADGTALDFESDFTTLTVFVTK
jgi:uncharacterized GH25 family protein